MRDGILNRNNTYSNVGNRDSEEYVQASISNRGNKYIWMLRGGIAWTDSRNDVGNGIVNYWLTDAAFNDGDVVNLHSKTRPCGRACISLNAHIFRKQELDYVADGYYSRNDFNRQYKDNDALYKSLVKEDYWYTS